MRFKKSEVEKIKKKLLEMKNQLSQSIYGATEEVKEIDKGKGYSQHQADEGTDDFDKTITLEVSNKEFSILKQIDRALEKIEEGSYGICDLSGKNIPKARLDAIPYANMTVEIQEKYEKGLF